MAGCLRQTMNDRVVYVDCLHAQNDTAVPWSIHATQTYNCEVQQKYVST